jgi:hypothetical protein
MERACDDTFEKPKQFSQHLQGPLHAHAGGMYRFPDFTTFIVQRSWVHTKKETCGRQLPRD